ncbi:PREDICTED: uncharacterized protein LOC106741970 [Dinoponera quadriceps]|uniref:Uncharacterized protein LOC106741970 n=1 Tax=Dinoponera quadriceps TaxID=609295 RepID=A0A6P3WVP6_DINQU|nr:PREDICTED: uncharacterized protein LOC106741970 [Dinoponera quadriceps]
MNRFFLVICMVLFANAIEISRKDSAEKLSVKLSKKKSQSQWSLNGITSDDERSARINYGFEKVVQFVNVLDHMDNFLYDKAKNFIRKLNVMYDMGGNERYRRTSFK